MEVDRLYDDMAKDQIEYPVPLGGPERDLFADQRLGCLHAASAEAEPGGTVDPAHNVVGPVLERLDPGAERARAGAVAIGWHRKVQGIVRAMMVVAVPPGIEGTLGHREIGEGAAVEQLGLERAVEALVLAMALRMIRRAVQRRHAMLDQPYAEPGQRPFPGVAP